MLQVLLIESLRLCRQLREAVEFDCSRVGLMRVAIYVKR
jgi:hypothetical protein